MSGGHLFVVGVGPGDPDLLTFKAARIIAAADAVAYPTTESGAARAREIAAAHVAPGAREIGFLVPMRTERGPGQAAYDEAAERISAELSAGHAVALLCEGDPMFYGSAMYLFERLAARFPTTVVPGITSLTACAAEAGRPLAARNEVLKVLPAPMPPERLAAELATCDAAAIVKVGRHIDTVRAVLREQGLEASSVLVERATAPDQAVTPLAALPDGARPYFSTILVYRGEEKWR